MGLPYVTFVAVTVFAAVYGVQIFWPGMGLVPFVLVCAAISGAAVGLALWAQGRASAD